MTEPSDVPLICDPVKGTEDFKDRHRMIAELKQIEASVLYTYKKGELDERSFYVHIDCVRLGLRVAAIEPEEVRLLETWQWPDAEFCAA